MEAIAAEQMGGVAVNLTGIHPKEFKVLVRPKEVEEKFANSSLIKPVEAQEKERWATTEGVVVDVSPAAFSFLSDDERTSAPRVGDAVIFAKYAGLRVTSKRDGKEYILLNDKDIAAVIKE